MPTPRRQKWRARRPARPPPPRGGRARRYSTAPREHPINAGATSNDAALRHSTTCRGPGLRPCLLHRLERRAGAQGPLQPARYPTPCETASGEAPLHDGVSARARSTTTSRPRPPVPRASRGGTRTTRPSMPYRQSVSAASRGSDDGLPTVASFGGGPRVTVGEQNDSCSVPCAERFGRSHKTYPEARFVRYE